MSGRRGLNDNHVRVVVTTLRRADELLSEAETIMLSAACHSHFGDRADDTTPMQRKVTHDYIVRLREMMSRKLEELDLPRPTPVSGALWAARNAVAFTSVAIAEMASTRLCGFGELSEEAALQIDGMVAELRSAVGELADYLAQGSGADLQQRLETLDRTSDETRLLGELARIVTESGLVELRHSLTMLLDRMQEQTLEVGVFGRVSSGKSSLLNHLLGDDYLPVGVTPVTAVPIRVGFGDRPQAVVEFADSSPKTIELAALTEFATEQGNPGNAKHVTRIDISVPADILEEGILFVDTPGLGSLATGGAEETVAYLPRCDLGILLADATAPLTLEDLKILDALVRAGASVTVLASKIDLLVAPDRRRVLNYVREQIHTELNLEPKVVAVSVAGDAARLCEEWFDTELRPLLDAHRDLRARSLKRKVGGLREAVIAALTRRIEGEAPGPATTETVRLKGLDGELRDANRGLEVERREAEAQARGLGDLGEIIIKQAAVEAADGLLAEDSPSTDPGTLVVATVSRLVAEESSRLHRRIDDVRKRLEELLGRAASVLRHSGTDTEDLPRPIGLPLCDPEALAGGVDLRRPAFLSLLGTGAVRRHVRAKLTAQIADDLNRLLVSHGRRLKEWADSSLTALAEAFAARTGVLRAQLVGPLSPLEGAAPTDDRLREDLRLLEEWSPEDGPVSSSSAAGDLRRDG